MDDEEKLWVSDLDMLAEEVLSDPDEFLPFGRLIALVGKEDTQRLVREAKEVLAARGGYASPPQTVAYVDDTRRLFIERLMTNLDWAHGLADAYNTLETGNAEEDEEIATQYAKGEIEEEQ